MPAIVPIPKTPIAIRVATMADLPFMDGLQKKYNKALGYFPTKQFEGYVESGGVLIAEAMNVDCGVLSVEGSQQSTVNSQQSRPLGYIISRDRYLNRDELGVIFQLCVMPGAQRGLIGASLVREVFERSAYGCRLYCCWCAQDLEANYFWESLGFVPIAFRARSSGKKRVHIFWQKRIDDADTATPYWYPFQTSSGAIRADRLVFPIPPGVHWRDVRAVEIPQSTDEGGRMKDEAKRLAGPVLRTPKAERRKPDGPGPGKVGIVVGGADQVHRSAGIPTAASGRGCARAEAEEAAGEACRGKAGQEVSHRGARVAGPVS